MKLARRTLLLFLVATLTACADDGPPPIAQLGAPASETSAPTPVIDASASGPVGTWRLDSAAMFELVRDSMDEEIPESVGKKDRALFREIVTARFEMMDGTLVLSADNTLHGTMTLPSRSGEPDVATLTGSWARSGDAYTLTTREEGKDFDKVYTVTMDGRTLTLKSDDNVGEIPLILQRQD